MAAVPFLDKVGFVAKSLGSAAALSFALGTSEGASRTGFYGDLTGGAEKIGVVVNGTEVVSVGFVASAPTLTVNGKGRVNTATTADSLAQVLVSTGATTNKALVLQGVAAQTANLQEWQNSAGTVIASISKSGAFANTFAGPVGGGDSYRISHIDSTYGRSVGFYFGEDGAEGGVLASNNLNLRGGSVVTIRPNRGDASPMTLNVYRVNTGATRGVYLVSTDATGASNSLGVVASHDAVPFYVKAMAGQTADLQQWQNSSGTVLASISSAGKGTFAAATTSAASLNLPHGTAPTVPANGDVWTTTAGVYVRINGTTLGLIGGTLGTTPQAVTANATITSGRVKFTGSTAAQTLTLPAGVAGTDCFIRNAGTVAVTVARAGSDTIEGLTTFVLQPGEAISLTYVGTDWTIF